MVKVKSALLSQSKSGRTAPGSSSLASARSVLCPDTFTSQDALDCVAVGDSDLRGGFPNHGGFVMAERCPFLLCEGPDIHIGSLEQRVTQRSHENSCLRFPRFHDSNYIMDPTNTVSEPYLGKTVLPGTFNDSISSNTEREGFSGENYRNCSKLRVMSTGCAGHAPPLLHQFSTS